VQEGTVGVLAHEFQHLINASRRMYVNDPAAPEAVWLNEGLSHISEELVFYSVSGLGPRQNITRQVIASSPDITNAFLSYQADNFGRLLEFIEEPETHSPFGSDDELATRGATWQLLRYAADRSTINQRDIWMRLANSKIAGIPNFTAVFGGEFFPLVRDWGTAQYTDDAVLQTPAVYQHPSWNFRSIFPAFVNNQPMPLKTRALVAGTPLSLGLRTGGAAYLRFGVAAGATGTITPTSSGAAPQAAVSFTVVRTR
jgi:hypothetical protein